MDKELKKQLEKDGIVLKGKQIGIRLISQGLVKVEADSSNNEVARAQLDQLSTFQPATREDLEPKPEEYIYPIYRALSQTILLSHYIDLRREGVLEASVPMLIGQTIYPNHWAETESWIGAVESAWWDKPEESGTPFETPGINVRLKVDWKVNPKIARGILMDPPALHSVSATFRFKWEKSHPDLDDRQFWTMLGEEVDGELVLIVVAEILNYDEISLVYQGADPEAKIIPETEPGEEEQTEASLKLSAGEMTTKPLLIADIIKNPSQTGGVQMEEKLKELMAKLKAETPEAALDAALTLAGQPAPDEKVIAVAEVLKKQGIDPEETGRLISSGGRYQEKLKEDLKTFATLAMCDGDEKLPDGFVESQVKGDIGQLEAAVNVYRKMAEQKYPLKCQDCGSTNVSSRSSARPDLGEEAEKASQAGKLKVDTSRIHG